MCLLTFLPAGVLPDTTALRHGAYVNDDGHGFAIVHGRQLIVERGLDAEDVIRAFDVARRRHPDGPALFHSRFSTHGDTGVDNCHPFPVAGDTRTVLAHNGVLPAVVHPTPEDPRSDTRITAEDYLPAFGSLRTRRARRRLEQWMTPHNKMVILTVDQRFPQRSYILNERSGIWAERIWYSNDGYLPPYSDLYWPAGRHDRHDLWASDVVDNCPLCRACISIADTECWHCGWCMDCHQDAEDCGCYPPSARRVRADRTTSLPAGWSDTTR